MSTQTSPSTSPETGRGGAAAPRGEVRPPWLVVMLHQISVTVRRRTFLVSTAITALIIVAGVVAFSLLSTKVESYTVAVQNQEVATIVSEAQATAGGEAAKLQLSAQVESDPIAAVRDKGADLALTRTAEGWSLTGRDSVPTSAQAVLGQAVERATIQEHAGTTGTDWASLTAGSQLSAHLLEGDAQRTAMAAAVGYVFAMLFYLASILFGMPIATSVLQEKASRVVEILAATIPLRQLLAGKILASMIVSVLQLALYVGVGLLALVLSPADLGFTGVIVSAAGWFLAFFVAGFLILAAVYAAIGAMAHRGEDLQSAQVPIMVVLVGTLVAGLAAKGQALVVLSFIPVVSSVTMPVRMLQSDVPWWQTALALALSLATAFLLVRVGGKVFRLAVLHTGGALNWKQALALKD